MFTYNFPRPSVTVDIIIRCKKRILLIQRKNPPFENMWALPGGFVDEDENLLDAANRELMEETALKGIALIQFHTYGDKGRDPRGHTVSVVYYGFCNNLNHAVAGDDAIAVKWFAIEELPPLAFDHEKIINDFIEKLGHYSNSSDR